MPPAAYCLHDSSACPRLEDINAQATKPHPMDEAAHCLHEPSALDNERRDKDMQ